MSRFGGRFVPNIEHEVRRQATEPIVKWRQEWVIPTNTSADGTISSSTFNSSGGSGGVGVKILKWVRVPDSLITFSQDQDVQAEDRISDDAAIVEAPVQSIHNAPAGASTPVGSSLSSAGGGLGTIAPKDPPASTSTAILGAGGVASAIPPHMTQNITTLEPTSGTNTTGESTPTEMSGANTPAPQPLTEKASSQGGGGDGNEQAPHTQPQVETQLHDQPTPSTAQETDNETLAILAAGAEAEQHPSAKDETLVSINPNANVPATTFQDNPPTTTTTSNIAANTQSALTAEVGDVDMKQA